MDADAEKKGESKGMHWAVKTLIYVVVFVAGAAGGFIGRGLWDDSDPTKQQEQKKLQAVAQK